MVTQIGEAGKPHWHVFQNAPGWRGARMPLGGGTLHYYAVAVVVEVEVEILEV
jgi:hypothetical protein